MLPFPRVLTQKVRLHHHVIGSLLVIAMPGLILLDTRLVITQLALGVAGAVGFDILIRAIMRRAELPISTSSIITGLIVAMVLSPGTAWYVILFGSAIAIASKHLIRVSHRHVLNPAAAGLAVTGFTFPFSIHGWWGDLSPLLTVAVGALIIWRIGRFHHLAAFFGAHFVLTAIRLVWSNIPASLIIPTGLATISPFLLFIMLPEPVTAPRTRSGRISHGALASIAGTVAAMFHVPAPLETGLIVANVLTRLGRMGPSRDRVATS